MCVFVRPHQSGVSEHCGGAIAHTSPLSFIIIIVVIIVIMIAIVIVIIITAMIYEDDEVDI